jgi:hypothetical protein
VGRSKVGDEVDLKNTSGEVLRLAVMAPDGRITVYPPVSGSTVVHLDQHGTWKYRWGDGDQHQFEVGERDKEPEIAEGMDARAPMAPMTVTRRPRF